MGCQRRRGLGSNSAPSVPVLISSLSSVVAISASGRTKVGHNLALKSDGTVWAWGSNFWSEPGSNGQANSNVALPVPGIRGAIALSAGGDHNVVLLPH